MRPAAEIFTGTLNAGRTLLAYAVREQPANLELDPRPCLFRTYVVPLRSKEMVHYDTTDEAARAARPSWILLRFVPQDSAPHTHRLLIMRLGQPRNEDGSYDTFPSLTLQTLQTVDGEEVYDSVTRLATERRHVEVHPQHCFSKDWSAKDEVLWAQWNAAQHTLYVLTTCRIQAERAAHTGQTSTASEEDQSSVHEQQRAQLYPPSPLPTDEDGFHTGGRAEVDNASVSRAVAMPLTSTPSVRKPRSTAATPLAFSTPTGRAAPNSRFLLPGSPDVFSTPGSEVPTAIEGRRLSVVNPAAAVPATPLSDIPESPGSQAADKGPEITELVALKCESGYFVELFRTAAPLPLEVRRRLDGDMPTLDMPLADMSCFTGLNLRVVPLPQGSLCFCYQHPGWSVSASSHSLRLAASVCYTVMCPHWNSKLTLSLPVPCTSGPEAPPIAFVALGTLLAAIVPGGAADLFTCGPDHEPLLPLRLTGIADVPLPQNEAAAQEQSPLADTAAASVDRFSLALVPCPKASSSPVSLHPTGGPACSTEASIRGRGGRSLEVVLLSRYTGLGYRVALPSPALMSLMLPERDGNTRRRAIQLALMHMQDENLVHHVIRNVRGAFPEALDEELLRELLVGLSYAAIGRTRPDTELLKWIPSTTMPPWHKVQVVDSTYEYKSGGMSPVLTASCPVNVMVINGDPHHVDR
jgi:hypothetical protein